MGRPDCLALALPFGLAFLQGGSLWWLEAFAFAL